MQSFIILLLLTTVVVSLSSTSTPQLLSSPKPWNKVFYTPLTAPQNEFKRILRRSPMPPRASPGTPPESRRQSIDTPTLSASKSLSKDQRNLLKKQHPDSRVEKLDPDKTAQALKTKLRVQDSKPPRSPSPRYSSGSDDGFVRTSEMTTSRIYGPPSSSDEDNAHAGEARRRRLRHPRYPYSLRRGNHALQHQHYSSDSDSEADNGGSDNPRHTSSAEKSSPSQNP